MGRSSGIHQVIRTVSDGTGLSEEEVVLLGAAAVVGTVVFGFLRAVDVLLELFPQPSGVVRH